MSTKLYIKGSFQRRESEYIASNISSKRKRIKKKLYQFSTGKGRLKIEPRKTHVSLSTCPTTVKKKNLYIYTNLKNRHV